MLRNIHILPVCIFILIPASFLITYCIAVSLNHVEVEFPYISDTGTYTPEKCIFSQAINLVSFLLFAFMYIQYKHVEQHYRDQLSSEYVIVYRLNKLAILVGWCGCLGISVIANFQETLVVIVHMTGALVAFGSAAGYCWLQTLISFYVCPLMNSSFVARIRLVLSLLLSAAFATTLVAGIYAHNSFHGKDATKWYPEDGGYTAHVISTAAEWILVIAFDFFILTYAKEMQRISLSSPKVHFNEGESESRNFYGYDDPTCVASQNSLRNTNSMPTSPYAELGRENVLTTRAIVH